MAGNAENQLGRRHLPRFIVTAVIATVVSVGSLVTWASSTGAWWIVAVIVIVGVAKAIDLKGVWLQPVVFAAVLILLRLIEGWAQTCANGFTQTFALHPYMYSAAAATALLCLLLDTKQLVLVRPATAVTIALSVYLMPHVPTIADLVMIATLVVLLVVVASILRMRRMYGLLVYAVAEPIIVAAVLWVMFMRTGAAGALASEGYRVSGIGEFEFIVGILPAAVTLICGIGALRNLVSPFDVVAEAKKI